MGGHERNGHRRVATGEEVADLGHRAPAVREIEGFVLQHLGVAGFEGRDFGKGGLIETRPTVSWKAPRKLFTSSPLDRTWDFAPDGRILAWTPLQSGKGEAVPSMIETENWFSEFRDKKKKK